AVGTRGDDVQHEIPHQPVERETPAAAMADQPEQDRRHAAYQQGGEPVEPPNQRERRHEHGRRAPGGDECGRRDDATTPGRAGDIKRERGHADQRDAETAARPHHTDVRRPGRHGYATAYAWSTCASVLRTARNDLTAKHRAPRSRPSTA